MKIKKTVITILGAASLFATGAAAANSQQASADAQPIAVTQTQDQNQTQNITPTQSVQQTKKNKLSKAEAAAKRWVARHESGGNYRAVNGSCYGKYQLTKSYLHGNLSKANQEKTADRYAHSRYGSWQNAKRFWQSHHWY